MQREIYVALPEEAGAPEGQCGKLGKCLYGTRDANQTFELAVGSVMTEAGFVRGGFSPCLLYCRKNDVRVFLHGDDFIVDAKPCVNGLVKRQEE